jgi:hypothetical protein
MKLLILNTFAGKVYKDNGYKNLIVFLHAKHRVISSFLCIKKWKCRGCLGSVNCKTYNMIIQMELYMQERKSKISFSDSNYIILIQGLI